MSLVWESYPTGGGELLTALAYADHAHDDGGGIRPSVAYMARKTRQSERTIQMHLSAMRRTGWLLTVRYAGGGRGRATEYRVNPGWIANPAEFAPFSDAQRVQPDTEKGAIDSTKGCKAFAPQPSRTVIEPTTTRSGGAEPAVVRHDELKWSSVFGGAVQASAMQLLQDCPIADRQNILDEIAALADRGAVRHPFGLLRKLVDLAKHGKFVPAAALDYRRMLDSQAKVAQARTTEEQRCRQQSTPQVRKAAIESLSLLRQQLTGVDLKTSRRELR